MPGTSPGMTKYFETFETKPHPALRVRAADRWGFLAARRCGVRRDAGACVRRFAAALPFRLAFSASIRLTTLLGRSSGSAALIVLPDALRRTSAFSAFSYSSLNFDGSKWAALVSRIWLANSTMSFDIFGF